MLSLSRLYPTAGDVISNKRVMLVIAHPDDEAMFFGPTLLHLSQPHLRNALFVLSLSNGNADGLGRTRERELVDSCRILGVSVAAAARATGHEHREEQDSESASLLPSPADARSSCRSTVSGRVCVMDDPEHMQDGMQQCWDGQTAAKVVREWAATWAIDVLVTFDSLGVSRHPNHIATHHAVCQLADRGRRSWEGTPGSRTDGPGAAAPALEVYALDTVNCVRKFAGPLELLLRWVAVALMACAAVLRRGAVLVLLQMARSRYGGALAWAVGEARLRAMASWCDDCCQPPAAGDSCACAGAEGVYLCVSPSWGVLLGRDVGVVWAAMRAHASQLVWYRRVFIVLSCYSYCNWLRRVGNVSVCREAKESN